MIRENGQESYWGIRSGFSSRVDFCIWVLELDGLQIFPFDRHRDGSGNLRARGMNRESWQSWVRKIVLLLDQRLHWHVEDLPASIGKDEDNFEHAVAELAKTHTNAVSAVDKSTFHIAHERYLFWQEKQYQRAVKAAKQAYGEFTLPSIWSISPPELWDGEPAIKELLRELWLQYHQSVYRERESQWNVNSEQQTDIRLWEALRAYHTCLDPLQFHLVCYPESVEYLVPPVSAILSVTDRLCNSDTFREAVLHVAEGLATHDSK